VRKLSLPGHEDWVRCLAMVSCFAKGSNVPDHLILASGSQDGSIRLWLIESLSADSPLAAVHNANATHRQMLDSIPEGTHYSFDSSTQIGPTHHVFKMVADDSVCVFLLVRWA
jgi:WD40 repeat protein